MQTLLIIVAILLLFISLYLVYLFKKIKEINKEIIASKTLINTIFDEFSKTRVENAAILKETILTLNQLISSNFQQISIILKDSTSHQREDLKAFIENINILNKRVDDRFKDILNLNEKKLEELRQTVDEKLQSTLEKRLTESFKTVSNWLENVYKGIGEMTKLASDVGDLKRVLTNVKQRGVFGELQLKKILEDILTPEQYLENVNIKNGYYVEFAIKIPSRDGDGKHILLPIDSKFPHEDYEKILLAQEKADITALNEATKSLAARIKEQASQIHDKYIDPPKTTDFAILFLPVEGLFAEVLRIPGLFEEVRNKHNIIITGPTTITAILNSLEMGFRTLSIEKKSYEVWKVLSAVKSEFIKFGDYLARTRKKLEDAANEIEKAEKRTSIIGKKLKSVETITEEEAKRILKIENSDIELENREEEKF